MSAFLLVLVVVTPLLVFWNFSRSSVPDFFVGVEYAIDDHSVEDAKALVDRTKDFTNLFVVDSFGITSDVIKLNAVCDYVYDSGLYFFVFFISPIGDQMQFRYNFWPHLWISDAKVKYGDKFLGTYAMDEPGGSQLDLGNFRMMNPDDIKNATQASNLYLENLEAHVDYYTDISRYEDITTLTADYGLYWQDYKAGYDAILAEFGWNHSRQLHVALCRGAAKMMDKPWGMIETWTYNDEPYMTSAEELYQDMVIAYDNGAKYVVIFDYPKTTYSDYGILTDDHFAAMEDFWDYINKYPARNGFEHSNVAYVLPENFGYGFRNNHDKLWGLDPYLFTEDTWGSLNATVLAEKVWNDVNQLLTVYGSKLDIIYDDPQFNVNLEWKYDKLFLWNQTLTMP